MRSGPPPRAPQARPDPAALLDAHPHELSDALAIDRLERVEGQEPPVHVVEEELRLRIVPAVPGRRLREVVRSEGEELRVPRDLVRRQGGAWDLDHRADLVVEADALALHDVLRDGLERDPLDLEPVHMPDEGDHDLWVDVD